MRGFRRSALSLCLVLVMCLLGEGQPPPVCGQGAASYLALGAGEGSLAGSCGGMVEGNSAAFYWNPALACYAGRFAYAEYAGVFGSFGGSLASLQVLGAGLPLRGGAAIQIGYLGFAVDDIPRYPDLGQASFVDRMEDANSRPTGQAFGWFSDREHALFVCFARSMRLRLRISWLTEEVKFHVTIGGSFKFLHQTLASWSASGTGLDVGAGLRIDLGQFSESPWAGSLLLALRRTDITGTRLHWDGVGGQRVQPTTSWSFAYQPRTGTNGSVQLLLQHDSGWESWTTAGVVARFSSVTTFLGRASSGLSFGVGVKVWRLQLLYGRQPFPLGNVERIGVRWTW